MRIPSLGETELLVPLHEGVFEQPMWGSFLARLRSVSGAECAALYIRAAETADVIELKSGGSGAPGRFDRIVADHIGYDPLGGGPLREGRVYDLAEMAAVGVDDPGLPQSPHHMRSMRLSEANALDAWIVLAGDAPFGAEVGNLLVALTPHLRVALRTLASIERERARARVSEQAFAKMNFGWIAIDRACRIVDCDDKASGILERSGVLRRGPYDRLTPASPSIDRQLTALARTCAENPKTRPHAINLGTDPWIDILVSPIRLGSGLGGSNAVAVVYLRGDRTSNADRCAQLAEIFDFTPAEARVAWSMAQGFSIAEAAEEHGLTVETTRYYSKKIYSKMGARGQVDLMHHILTGVLALA